MFTPQFEDITRKPFRTYFRWHKRTVVIGLTALCLTNALDALPPLLVGESIDAVANHGHGLWKPLGILLLVVTFLAFARYYWRLNWGYFHHAVAENLRNRVFERLTQAGHRFFQKNTVGALMSLVNNDVNQFRMAIGPGVLVLMDSFFILLVVPPLMIHLSPSWTWKTLVLMPLIPIFVRYLIRWIHRTYEEQRNAFADISGHTQEVIAGIRVIKSYAQEDQQTKLYEVFNRRFRETSDETAKANAWFQPILETGVTAGAVILLLVGAPDVMSGAISVGSFLAFYQYIQKMVWPMTAIAIGLSRLESGKASFSKIKEVLAEIYSLTDVGAAQLRDFESLELQDVTYRHAETNFDSIRNVSFSMRAGEVVGILGPTGSGKSTLLDLISRLSDPTGGRILMNNVPLQEIPLHQLRQLITYIPQETFLFNDKIKNNIDLEGLINEEELNEVTGLVEFSQEVSEIPGQFEALLGERGVNLSGGQKQRISIARGLVRKSPLLLLDDNLSAVDAQTERKILQRIREFLHTKRGGIKPSAIIVSHRLASLQLADRIIVLNNGHIEAQGTQDQLLKTSPTYLRVSDLQFKGGRHGEP